MSSDERKNIFVRRLVVSDERRTFVLFERQASLFSKRGVTLLCTLPALCIGGLRGRQHHSGKSSGANVPAFFDMLACNTAEKCGGYEPRTADDCRR